MTVKYSVCAIDLLDLTGKVVAAYVSNNSIPASELIRLIQNVHSVVCRLSLDGVCGATTPAAENAKPSAIEIRRSIQHEGIVSFIDGRTYKTLKRHLTAHGFHPRSYRERYGLPAEYPMVAPSYAEQRSVLAKAIKLGQPGAMAERLRRAATGR